MRFSPIVGAMALVASLAFAHPIIAQQCFELAGTIQALTMQGNPHKVLSPTERDAFVAALSEATGREIVGVTNVLLADIEGETFFGLEMEGKCLLPPAPLAQFLPEEKRSGWTPVGIFA